LTKAPSKTELEISIEIRRMPNRLKKKAPAILGAPDLAACFPDLATWPANWCGGEIDIIPGK